MLMEASHELNGKVRPRSWRDEREKRDDNPSALPIVGACKTDLGRKRMPAPKSHSSILEIIYVFIF